METLGGVLYAGGRAACETERHWASLVACIAAGDQLALHALYERTHRPVFTLALRITGNRETAEEVTVDVFHEVWRRASGYHPANGTVLGWIMNQARSRALDRVRFEQRKKRAGELPERAETEEWQDVVELKEQAAALRASFDVLSTHERQVIELAFFSELTYADVAAKLAQPLGTVKTRIRSGLQKLRQALALSRRQP
jgi:RNA polymerase sigma-70 factor, ECF subfamily